MPSRAFVAAACLLLVSSVFAKSDADAAGAYTDSTILSNFLRDSKAVAFANQKKDVLPTEASVAFYSLLTQVSNGNPATTQQQNIVHQLSSVIQLLAKQGPTPALVQFVNQTNTMIETQLKANIRQGLVNLSSQVNSSFTQGYQRCDAAYTSAVGPSGTVASLTQAFVLLVPDFSSCRAIESTLQTSTTQAATLAASLSATQASKCATFSAVDASTLSCPALTGENASAYALRMSTFFGQQNSNWILLRSDCANATIAASTQNSTSQAAASSWSTQKTTCDNKQDFMDAASCNVYTASVTACQDFQGCYTQFSSSFQTYQQGYNSQLSGLVSQWASLLQMQCLINGIVNSSVSQNCSNQVLMTQQATQSLPLYYPAPLSAPSCTTAVGYAGTPTYVQNIYNVLPANAQAKFCVASCCPTTTTTTTQVALISGSMSFNLPTVSASQLQSSLPAALAASLGVSASQVSVSVSGSSSPYSVTYFVSAPLSSQTTIRTTINGFATSATSLQTNLASQLTSSGATVASSAVGVSGVSAPSSSTVGSQNLPNLASAVAVSSGSLTLNLGSVTGSTSTVQAAAFSALTAYFGTSQVMTNVTLVRSSPLTFNVSYNVSFPIGSLPTLQTLTTGATSSALQTSLTTALTSGGISTGSLSVQNYVAPVAGLVPASNVIIVATTTATTTTLTTTTLTTVTGTTTSTTVVMVPIWVTYNGAASYTYAVAESTCSALGGSLCTKAQYCKNGAINTNIRGLESGQVSAALDKWAPYADANNGWIHTSNTGWKTCQDHLASPISTTPRWGTTGSKYGNTMCCQIPAANMNCAAGVITQTNWNCDNANLKQLSQAMPCSSRAWDGKPVPTCVSNFDQCAKLAAADPDCSNQIRYYGTNSGPSGNYAGACSCIKVGLTCAGWGEPGGNVAPLLCSAGAISLLGCYPYLNAGAPAGWAAYSSTPGSDTWYYSGARLSGSYDSIVTQCNTACLANAKYTHMSIHDSTACFCGIQAPTSSPTGAAASSCGQNSVYRIRQAH